MLNMSLFKSKKDLNKNYNNNNNIINNIGINIYFDKQNLNNSLNFKINENYSLSDLIEHCGKEIFEICQYFNKNNEQNFNMKDYNFLIKDDLNPLIYIKLKPKDKLLKFLKNENKKIFFLHKNYSLSESLKLVKIKKNHDKNNDKFIDKFSILNVYKKFFQKSKEKKKIKYINFKEKNISVYNNNNCVENILLINDTNLIFKYNIFGEENFDNNENFEIKLIDIKTIEEINNKNELKNIKNKDKKNLNFIRLKFTENSNLKTLGSLIIGSKEKIFYQEFVNILIKRDFLVLDKRFDEKIEDNKNVITVCTDWFLEKFFEYKYLISQKESRFLFFKLFKNNYNVDVLDRILKYQYEINNNNFIKVIELYKLITTDLNNLKIKIDNLKNTNYFFEIYNEKKGKINIETIFDKFIFNDVFYNLSEKSVKNYYDQFRESYLNKIEDYFCDVNNEYLELVKMAKLLLPLISKKFYKFYNLGDNYVFFGEKDNENNNNNKNNNNKNENKNIFSQYEII